MKREGVGSFLTSIIEQSSFSFILYGKCKNAYGRLRFTSTTERVSPILITYKVFYLFPHLLFSKFYIPRFKIVKRNWVTVLKEKISRSDKILS